MSCTQIQALVQSRGAVVISTGQYTYQRFVAAANYCAFDQVLDRAWITTAGGTQCQVGFRCKDQYPFVDR